MRRRQFIHAATASLLLPTAVKTCVAALATISQNRDYVFFDERFEKARRVAASWSASDRLIGVQGDVTPWWSNGLDRTTRDHPLNLRGVTTESFHFCLRVLVGEYANLEVQVSRLDRNLFLWTMCTTPKPDFATTPWLSPYHRV
jgi:hypothetical protein